MAPLARRHSRDPIALLEHDVSGRESKDQTIFRVAQRELPFTPIGNGPLQDWSLPLEVLGLLARILSLPRDWSFRATWFFQKSGCGRNRGYRLLKKLIDANYAQRTAHRHKNGTIKYWSYVFTDVPGDFGIATDQLPLFGEVDERAGKTNGSSKREQLPQKQDLANQDLDNGDTTKETLPQTNNRTKQSSARDRARGRSQSELKVAKDGEMALTPSPDAIARGLKIATGWDRAYLLQQFRSMNEDVEVRNVDGAWIGFCKLLGPNPDKPAFKTNGKPATIEEAPSGQTRIFRLGTEWQAWIDHLDSRDRAAADRMRSSSTFMVYVPSRMPVADSDRPTFPRTKAEA